MPAKVIRLRYAGTCIECGLALAARTSAWWDAEARSTTCAACRPLTAEEPPTRTADPPVPEVASEAPSVIATGVPGASARREYERRHQRREQKIDQRWGPLASLVKFLSDDPRSTVAWAKGSEGERFLAARLQKLLGERAVLLHDLKLPRTRGNIDHVAVAASGVWVIDTKKYKGRVEGRDVGGVSKTDLRLYVGGRDQTKLADALAWQIGAVREALGGAEVPIHAALCFVEAERRLFAKPFRYKGVWVTWSRKLADMIAEPGPLTPADVTQVASRIAVALPPEVPPA